MNYIWIHFDEKLSELIGFYSGVNKNILVSPFALVFFTCILFYLHVSHWLEK